MTDLPNVRFISGELRVGGFSITVGLARDASGRLAVTAGESAPASIVDAGPVAATSTAMIALGLAAIASYKVATNVGGSTQTLEEFINYKNPSVTFSVHHKVGFSVDLEGHTSSISVGAGTVLPGYQVSIQTGQILPIPSWMINTFNDSAKVFIYFSLKAQGVDSVRIKDLTGIDGCFAAGTPIHIDEKQTKLIEDINYGDTVLCYDPADAGGSELHIKKITRIFKNITTQFVDLRGVICTPGHVFATVGKDGLENSGFATIAQILRDNSSILSINGEIIRARTGARIGSKEDSIIRIRYYDSNSIEREALVYAGIPVPPTKLHEGKVSLTAETLCQHLTANNITLSPSGRLHCTNGEDYDSCNWPKNTTPFHTNEACNWIIEVEGKTYSPGWITDLVEEGQEFLEVSG